RDPVVRALEKATEGGRTVVLKVVPEDIEEQDYRRYFFEKPQIVERISFVERLKDRWLIMNVARRAPLQRFSDEEVASLAAFSQLLFPLAALQPGHGARLTVEELETR